MATSGQQDTPDTVRMLCTSALRKAGVVSLDATPAPEEMQTALDTLGPMLRSWAAAQIHLWAEKDITVTTVANQASYTLSPRALALLRAYNSLNGYRSPIRIATREQYSRLPYLAQTGTPYMAWLDRQRAASVLTLYPVPLVAGTVIATVRRVLDDPITLDEDLDVPPEWEEAVIYNLAARLCDDNGRGGEIAGRVAQRADALLTAMQGQDREGSVYFRASRRYGRY